MRFPMYASTRVGRCVKGRITGTPMVGENTKWMPQWVREGKSWPVRAITLSPRFPPGIAWATRGDTFGPMKSESRMAGSSSDEGFQ